MTTDSIMGGIATLINPSVKECPVGLFGKKSEEQKVWKCQHCSMTFDDKERMKRHMKKAHSERAGDDMPNTSPFGFK